MKTQENVNVYCPKGAIVSLEQHQTHIRAIETWQRELSANAPITAQLYTAYFNNFCKFINQTPDQILQQRIQDDKSQDKPTKRRYETLFKEYLRHKHQQNYKPTTLQTIYASIRSFFELHDYPLKMRRKDYPKGKAIGVKATTREEILKVLDANPDNIRLHAIILTLNDSGLGVSDLKELKCGLFQNKNPKETIMYQALRQKTGDEIKTFFAEESITAIQTYIKHRQTGTRKTPPETITPETPVFIKHSKSKLCKMTRTDLSTAVQSAYARLNMKHLSAHSIRKKLQTSLESANVNANWIDHILGHELINSRGAYSKPTNQQLQAEYERAYTKIRVYEKEKEKEKTTQEYPQYQEATTLEQCKQLLAKGYKFEMNHNGTSLFSKPQQTITQ